MDQCDITIPKNGKVLPQVYTSVLISQLLTPIKSLIGMYRHAGVLCTRLFRPAA